MRARVLLITIAALLAALAGAVLWHIRPVRTAFLTDADAIRAAVDVASPRDVLWSPARGADPGASFGRDEDDLRAAPDGVTIYFVRHTADGGADLFSSVRTPDGWSDPVGLVSLNTAADEIGPEPTADGRGLYFASDRAGGHGGYDVWFAERSDDGWAAPVNLGPAVNSAANEYGPAVTADGAALYFASNRPRPDDAQTPSPDASAALAGERGRRDYDLYRSLAGDDGFGPAEPLVALSSRFDEAAPALSGPGDFLYFGSNRPGGLGGFDLYRARLLGRAHGPVESLGDAVNSAANEIDPLVDASGFTLHFRSDRGRTESEDGPPVADAGDGGDAGADDDAAAPAPYELYVTHSREVFLDSITKRAEIDWAAILPLFIWLLLILLLVWLLWQTLTMLRSQRFRTLSLIVRCLVASLLVHALLMVAFAFWGVGSSLSDWVRDGSATRVVITSPSVGGDMASQIRGELTEVTLPAAVATIAAVESPLATVMSVPFMLTTVEPSDVETIDEPLDVDDADDAPTRPVPPPPPAPRDVARAELDDLTVTDTASRRRDAEASAPPLTAERTTMTQQIDQTTPAAPEPTPALVDVALGPTSIDIAEALLDPETPADARPAAVAEASPRLVPEPIAFAMDDLAPAPVVTSRVVAEPARTTVPVARSTAQRSPSAPAPIDDPADASVRMTPPATAVSGIDVRPAVATADDAPPRPLAGADAPAGPSAADVARFDPASPRDSVLPAMPSAAPGLAREATPALPVGIASSAPARAPAPAPASDAVRDALIDTAAASPAITVARERVIEASADESPPTPPRIGPPAGTDAALPATALALDLPAAVTIPPPVRTSTSDAGAAPTARPLERAADPALDATAPPAAAAVVVLAPAGAADRTQTGEPPDAAAAARIPDAATPRFEFPRLDADETSGPPVVDVALMLPALDEPALVPDADHDAPRRAPVVREAGRAPRIEADETFASSAPVAAAAAIVALAPAGGTIRARAERPLDVMPGPAVPDAAAPRIDAPHDAERRVDPPADRMALALPALAERAVAPWSDDAPPPPVGIVRQAERAPHVVPDIDSARVTPPLTEIATQPVRFDVATAARIGPDPGADDLAPLLDTAAPAPEAAAMMPAVAVADLELTLPDLAPANPYIQRAPERRREIVEEMGGSEMTEEAVTRALGWLERHQSADGHWDSAEYDEGCGGCIGAARADVDIAVTALSLLAYLAANHTHVQDGPYRDTVARGLDWLLARQDLTGDLIGRESMYSHGIATIALAEAYGMSGDTRLEEPLRAAVEFILAARNERVGGWRYAPGQAGDTSVLGWQIMALASARRAGLTVPDEGFHVAERWLARVSSSRRPGLYAYQKDRPVTAAMTAEGMFVQNLLGCAPDTPDMQAGAAYLLGNLPEWGTNTTYYWYYATLALFQHQGDAWQRWNEIVKDELLAHQHATGRQAGSWDPADRWSRTAGRVYQTAICTLTLEVYYRYLPTYLRAEKAKKGTDLFSR